MAITVLVTGGAGYIGSHTCVELLEAGYRVVVIDNLCNSKQEALQRVESISQASLIFERVDITDTLALENVFRNYQFDAVIHFAGLKAVGESTQKPLWYYHNNIAGTINLCDMMSKYGVYNLVFSSSATVYGDPEVLPLDENAPTSATNPYGRSKLVIEEILSDLYASDNRWNIARLRYFNPVGAHPTGLIGEDPNGIPNNLMPFIAQVAVGKRPQLAVFGNDYPTPDGTGVRDYIHVVDLAQGHIKALEKLTDAPGLVTYNLGTGQGYSVLDMVNAFAKASGQPIPYEIEPRRAGDVAELYANPEKALNELGWQAKLGIDEMTADTWRWQSSNPHGYETL